MNEHLNGKSSLINEQKIISLFIFLGLLIRLIFVFAIPAWQSPDEYPHYWVMEKIADENALPDTNPNFPAYEAFQPPLYYIIGSIVVDLYQEDIVFTLDYITPPTLLLLIRLLSAIAGMLVIFFTYLIVKEIPDLKPYDRIGSVVFVAFLPTFIGVSSTVNNDTFAVLFSAICLYYILKPNWDNKIALKSGFWAGIALATKLSSVVLLPIIFLRLLLLGINVHNRIRWLLLSILTWSIGASIFLIRNLIQFGSVFISDPGYEAKFSFSISFLVWALRNLMK
jgi:4-amino-4-deoxy-L-arabinose transferase-like glycosyltransferase